MMIDKGTAVAYVALSVSVFAISGPTGTPYAGRRIKCGRRPCQGKRQVAC